MKKKDIMSQKKTEIEMIKIPAKDQKVQIKNNNNKLTLIGEFSDNYYMSETPITQEQYEEVMGENPSHFRGKKLPVEMVSWWDAIKFCNKLSQKENREVCYNIETGECDFQKGGYRLPTEVEWEYACRGGTLGDMYGDLKKIAWYNENSEWETHPVGKKKPNRYGLYDMLGNVCEWCHDWHSNFYGISRPESSDSVVRGGSWYNPAEDCSCAFHSRFDPEFRNIDIGFRLVSSSRS